MLWYVVRRLVATGPVLLGVSLLVFSMVHLLPGDPVVAMLGESGASSQDVERLRQQLGLNDPLPVQFARFVSRAAVGDLGRSIRSNRPVVQEIADQLPSTVELAVSSMLIAVILGLVIGTIAAYRHNTRIDTFSMLFSLVGVSAPSFWIGLMLLFVFAVGLGWLPITGQGGLERLIMPAATLGFILSAVIARLTRSAMLDVLSQDYVRTARAKGLAEKAVLVRHALRNSLAPVVTVIGLQFGTVMTGAVVLESVFARQGIGRLVVSGIQSRDLPIVQGVALLMAVTYIVINLAVDLAYVWIDPRLRERAG